MLSTYLFVIFNTYLLVGFSIFLSTGCSGRFFLEFLNTNIFKFPTNPEPCPQTKLKLHFIKEDVLGRVLISKRTTLKSASRQVPPEVLPSNLTMDSSRNFFADRRTWLYFSTNIVDISPKSLPMALSKNEKNSKKWNFS